MEKSWVGWMLHVGLAQWTNAVPTCILRQKINETYDCSYQFFLKIACADLWKNSLYRRYHWSESTWVMMTPNISSSCFRHQALGMVWYWTFTMSYNLWWLYTCWCSFTSPHDLQVVNKFVASIEISPSKPFLGAEEPTDGFLHGDAPCGLHLGGTLWNHWFPQNGWFLSWKTLSKWMIWGVQLWSRNPEMFSPTPMPASQPEVWRSDIWRPKLSTFSSENTWRNSPF